MILYDSNLKLLGVSEDVLSLLGYECFDEFFVKNSDINNIFTTENSTADKINSYFLDSIAGKKEQPGLLLKIDGFDEIKAFVTKFCLTENQSLCYEINFQKEPLRQSNSANLSEQTLNFSRNQLNIDETWLSDSAARLGFSVDDFEIFLTELIKSAKEHEDMLHEAIINDNKNSSRAIISLLKDPAKTLDLKPIILALDNLENAQNSAFEQNFTDFQHILNTINKFLQKRKEL